MILVGCDLHSRKQQVAALDTNTGEVLEQELAHTGDAVEQFYRALPRPVTVGIETTGYTLAPRFDLPRGLPPPEEVDVEIHSLHILDTGVQLRIELLNGGQEL